ncbi:unnamed protein product [Closterium sp. Yama58-4]|nr:unnamed protein product [Closterium sp. Yama58-4]
MPSLFSAIIAAVAIYISASWLAFLRRRSSLPPGPSPWPILGNLPDLGFLPYRGLAKLADRFGPIMNVWLGSIPSVIISSPEMAREVLKIQDKFCSSRPLLPLLAFLTSDGNDIVFSPSNDHWRMQRRLATLHLFSSQALQKSLPVREREIRDMLDAIAEVANNGDARGVEVRGYLNRATLNNVMRLAFGKGYTYRTVRRAAAAAPGEMLEAAFRIDWQGRIAAMKIDGAKSGESAAQSAAEIAADELEGEMLIAIVDETFKVMGTFNLADFIPWLSRVDPQRIYARGKRLKPCTEGFVMACIEERSQMLKRRRREEEEGGGKKVARERPLVDGILEGEEGTEGEGGEGVGGGEVKLGENKLGKDASAAEGGKGGGGGVTLGAAEPGAERVLVDALLELVGEGEGEEEGVAAGNSKKDRVTRRDIMLLCLDLINAGTDTTAKTVEWALAELASHPTMLERLQAEVDAAYSKSATARAVTGEAVAEEAVGESIRAQGVEKHHLPASLPVQEMPYLHAVIKETLRHHPPTPLLIPHMTTDRVTIGGYTIPPNTIIQINAWGIAHNPTAWINPHEFDPSRFLGPSAPDVTGQHYEVLPFGSGRRVCAGMNLGLDLAARMLASILLRFDLTLPDDVVAAGGVDFGEDFSLNTALAKPLRLVLKERKQLQF